MKNFDLEAAKKGAKVCTRDGYPARILCFDLKNDIYPIAAVYEYENIERFASYTEDGRFNYRCEDAHDLMMAQDDYIEKLERGEYDKPSTSDNVAFESESKLNSDPWVEFKRQASLAMIQAARGGVIRSLDIEQILRSVNILVEGLKKM